MKKIDYLIIGIVSLVLILIHLIFWNHFFNPDFGADQRLYWNQGFYLYKSNGFFFNPAFGLYEPYIPFIVYLSLNVFGDSYIPVIWYNIVLYTAMTSVLYVFSKEIFASRLWAAIIVLLIITNNTFIQFNFLLARETSTVTILTLLCLGFYYYFKNHQKWLLFLLSILSAIFLLNDNRYYPYFLLFIFIWGIYQVSRHKEVRSFLIFLILISVLLLPWSYRNYKANGYFLPISGARLSYYMRYLPEKSFMGIDRQKLYLWTSNADRAGMNGDSSLLSQTPPPVETGYAAAAGYHNQISEQEYNSMYEKKSKGRLGKAIDYLGSFWAFCQFKYKIGPGTDDRIYPSWSLIRNINEIVHTGLLIPLFLTGLWFALKQKKKIIIILASLVLLHTIIHVILGSHLMRYRYQVMPLFTIVSVYGLFYIFDPLLKKLPYINKLLIKLS